MAKLAEFVGAAGAIIRNSQGKILLVKPHYRRGFDTPGGMIETSESPSQALVREVYEEIGIHISVGRLLAAHYYSRAGKFICLFDGGIWDGQLTELKLQMEEIEWVEFFSQSEIAGVSDNQMIKKRILHALAVLENPNLDVYLEDIGS